MAELKNGHARASLSAFNQCWEPVAFGIGYRETARKSLRGLSRFLCLFPTKAEQSFPPSLSLAELNFIFTQPG